MLDESRLQEEKDQESMNKSITQEAIPDEVVDEIDENANNQTQFKIVAQTCDEEA